MNFIDLIIFFFTWPDGIGLGWIPIGMLLVYLIEKSQSLNLKNKTKFKVTKIKLGKGKGFFIDG